MWAKKKEMCAISNSAKLSGPLTLWSAGRLVRLGLAKETNLVQTTLGPTFFGGGQVSNCFDKMWRVEGHHT